MSLTQTQTHRQQCHAAAKVSGRELKIVEALHNMGPMTRNKLSCVAGLTIQSVCGGVGSLIDKGAVFTTEATGGQLVTLDSDPNNWQTRAEHVTRQKQLDRIKEFEADYRSRLDAAAIEGLRRLYAEVKMKPL